MNPLIASIAVVLLCALHPLTGAEMSPDELARADLLDAIYADPPIDGDLIVEVADGSPALALDLRPGDIVRSYDGVVLDQPGLLPDLMAREGASPIAIVVRRAGTDITVAAARGELGIDVRYVRAGVDSGDRVQRPVPLPAATEVAFDFTIVSGSGVDWWHRFHFGDHDEHVGYAHFTMSRQDSSLRCVYDWCFDGGQYGLIGGYQRSRFDVVGDRPRLVATLDESNDGTSVAERSIVVDAAGSSWWRTAVIAGEASEPGKPIPLPTPAMLLDALQMQLACLMPREVGACVHYCFASFDGASPEMAMRVEGAETITLADGSQRHAWRVQHHHEYGLGMASWVADDGTLLRTRFGPAYGEAWHELSTRDAATAGLDPAIRVRLDGAPLSGR